MIYITQLIYLKHGKEDVFHEFENFAIPLMERYNGKIIYRIRPTQENFVDLKNEPPYEIHFMSFESENDLKEFMSDDSRLQFIHLKNESIESIFLVKGKKM